MSETVATKAKKSVALSGTVAGNTAVCTVGHTGTDLHYRGYDILDFAEQAEFEEIAHLLIHGVLPNRAELAAYQAKLKALRGLPPPVRQVLECIPASAHPMDVLRTGCSMLGTCEPEGPLSDSAGTRDAIDRLLASLGSMLMYWHHYSTAGRRIEVMTEDDTTAGHLLHLLHGKAARPSWIHEAGT